MKESTSIKEIAEMTGVSVATVSRVINNNGRFSEDTREKVLKAIKETGYKQNKLAVGLRKNKSNIIGILVPDITNEFYSSVVKRCEQTLADAGYACIVCNTDRSATKENNYLRTLSEHMVDGLIIISTNPENNSLILDVPVIYIDRNPSINSKVIVSSDHYKGAQIATNYLIESGFSPYMITTKTTASATQERLKGFLDTLNSNKIDPKDRVVKLNLTSNQFLDESLEAKRFLQSLENKHAGIFAINDYVAYITLKSALKLGVNVPQDLSIIGFDDSPISKISTPTISSIHQNTDMIAEDAAKLMIKSLENPTMKMSLNKMIPVNLVLRETTVQ
jgi:LacI family transcriptional regulator